MQIPKSIYAAVGILTISITYTVGYLNGRSAIQAKWDKAITAQTQQDHKVLLVGMKDSYDTGLAHEEQKQEIKYVTNTLIKEVPKYIVDTSTCPRLPSGYSQLYNRAAQAINNGIATGKFNDPTGAAAADAGEPSPTKSP